jgi:NAD(P)-dependent dehydrogenase (short-subunit alcohol dehydrogenase family)
MVGPVAFAKMTQLVVEPMQKACGGAVINISSISAHISQPNRWTYNAARGAVDQLTKCSALDLAPLSIRVISVSPGWIWSRTVDEAAGYDREKFDPIWGKYHRLRRCGYPEEVASAVLFLCSDEASFITGTDLPVDGGYLGLGGEGVGEASIIPGSVD